MKVAGLFLLAASFAAALPLPLHESEDVVDTVSGPVRGLVRLNSRAFLGIRYAAELTPEKRWTAPVPPAPWTEIANATEFTVGCPQRCVLPPGTCPDRQSEDCLFLSVYTPRLSATRPAAGWPVMAFIHGGRFEQGSAGGTLYDGDQMVQAGVVQVVFNYRLNILGWLATDELDGNHGLRDQQLALKWIQENIARFGGNPNLVTLFGQSAGGGSISAHLSSPSSTGLFHRAILQSNPWSIRLRGEKDARSFGAAVAHKAGCPKKNNLECLRNKTMDELFDAYAHVTPQPEPHPLNMVLRWTPTVDGKTVVDQPVQLIRRKEMKPVPLMIGNVVEDGRLFIFELSAKPISLLEYRAANAAVFGKGAPKLLAHYPDTNATDARETMSGETTDGVFECCNRWAVSSLHEASPSTPVYLYRFDHALSWDAWGPRYTYCIGHVCHGAELPIVFGSAQEYMSPAEKQLSIAIRNYWTSFAKSDDASPNYPGGVEWPAYTPQTPVTMLLNETISTEANVNKEACDLWDSINWYQKQ